MLFGCLACVLACVDCYGLQSRGHQSRPAAVCAAVQAAAAAIALHSTSFPE